MEDKKYVYLVEHRTWMGSKVLGIYDTEGKANKFAKHKEDSKTTSDGYTEYYVVKCELQ